ncbi:MAG: ABC transporter ATP-binding protein [Planctomycetes bacterium]|nr:ABC transporter ATP-binding protein [Planctomycetota bacterium]
MSAADRPLLEVEGLVKRFPIERGVFRRPAGWVRAVDGVSFEVRRGETLCLVGESGSGKTTLGRVILRLLEPTAGDVRLDGESILRAAGRRLRRLRRDMQVVFQDPYGSLNPRMTAGAAVAEGLVAAGVRSRREREERAAAMLRRVGLDPAGTLGRYPHELSGGQRQRVAIARALVLRPRFVVCDEPVSSLDLSVQAQILNLLLELKAQEGYTYLFITHDMSVVRHVADRVAVMYLGRIVEIGPAAEVLAAPHHPYTRALLEAAPATHPRDRGRRKPLEGEVPSPASPPPGCRFHTRCPLVMDRCRSEEPPAKPVGPGHVSWCFLEPPAAPVTAGTAGTSGTTRGTAREAR